MGGVQFLIFIPKPHFTKHDQRDKKYHQLPTRATDPNQGCLQGEVKLSSHSMTCNSRPAPIFSGEHDKNPYFEVHANLSPVCFKLPSPLSRSSLYLLNALRMLPPGWVM